MTDLFLVNFNSSYLFVFSLSLVLGTSINATFNSIDKKHNILNIIVSLFITTSYYLIDLNTEQSYYYLIKYYLTFLNIIFFISFVGLFIRKEKISTKRIWILILTIICITSSINIANFDYLVNEYSIHYNNIIMDIDLKEKTNKILMSNQKIIENALLLTLSIISIFWNSLFYVLIKTHKNKTRLKI